MVKRYLLAFACLLLCVNASAAKLFPVTGPNPFELKPQNLSAPATIQADNMYYDPQTKQVKAEGHVEIGQDQRILFADQVIYNQETGQVDAQGHISILEPGGQVYFADKVQLTEAMKLGVIRNFRALLIDKSRLAANSAQRMSETVTKLQKAVYSPCELCKENPNQEPLWQIRAGKIKLDEEEQRVSYRDADIDLYGIPILYTPYFSHPMPGADNKSGFLMPTYRSSTIFGPSVQTPYYFAIAPNMDLTLAPIFTTNEGPIMTGEFRHLTDNGGYKIKASITDPGKLDVNGNPIPGNDLRGHIEGEGKFDLDNDWAWGFSGKRATDDTYLRRYKFGNEDTLTSTAYINQIKNRDFIEIRALTFQGLDVGDNPDTTPFILPMTTTHFESTPGYLGSKLTFDSSTNILYRNTGVQSRHVSATGGYDLPIITPNGSLFEFGAKVRGDVYSVENVGYDGEQNTPGRLIPELDGQWSYPMMRRLGEGNFVVEPIIGAALSPYGENPKDIPNEDSQNFEINDLNVFSTNKFTGNDRVEDGPRANYGVRTNYTTDSNKNVGLLLGESYRLRQNRQDDEIGLEPGASSYVGRLDINDGHYVDFTYNFRLNPETNHFERSEISDVLTLKPVTLAVDYIYLDDEFHTLGGDREEISGDASYQFHPLWQLVGNIRRGLGETEQNGGLISSGLGVLFRNECLGFSLIMNREYTRDRDIPPSTSVTFQLALKNLN